MTLAMVYMEVEAAALANCMRSVWESSHTLAFTAALAIHTFYLSAGGFFQSSAQPHESAARQQQRAASHNRHTSLLIPVATIGKCKQGNEFQSHHYGHLALLIIHERDRPNSRFKVVLP